jgi:hypothetical protein
MPFPDYIVKLAWTRSGGRCECTSPGHEHIGRCNRRLLELYRGDIETTAGWEARSKSGSYLDDPSDCEILCWECQDDVRYL